MHALQQNVLYCLYAMSTIACGSIQAICLYIVGQHVPSHKAMLLKPLPPVIMIH
jgi:hypothetical protein